MAATAGTPAVALGHEAHDRSRQAAREHDLPVVVLAGHRVGLRGDEVGEAQPGQQAHRDPQRHRADLAGEEAGDEADDHALERRADHDAHRPRARPRAPAGGRPVRPAGRGPRPPRFRALACSRRRLLVGVTWFLTGPAAPFGASHPKDEEQDHAHDEVGRHEQDGHAVAGGEAKGAPPRPLRVGRDGRPFQEERHVGRQQGGVGVAFRGLLARGPSGRSPRGAAAGRGRAGAGAPRPPGAAPRSRPRCGWGRTAAPSPAPGARPVSM